MRIRANIEQVVHRFKLQRRWLKLDGNGVVDGEDLSSKLSCAAVTTLLNLHAGYVVCLSTFWLRPKVLAQACVCALFWCETESETDFFDCLCWCRWWRVSRSKFYSFLVFLSGHCFVTTCPATCMQRNAHLHVRCGVARQSAF